MSIVLREIVTINDKSGHPRLVIAAAKFELFSLSSPLSSLPFRSSLFLSALFSMSSLSPS